MTDTAAAGSDASLAPVDPNAVVLRVAELRDEYSEQHSQYLAARRIVKFARKAGDAEKVRAWSKKRTLAKKRRWEHRRALVAVLGEAAVTGIDAGFARNPRGVELLAQANARVRPRLRRGFSAAEDFIATHRIVLPHLWGAVHDAYQRIAIGEAFLDEASRAFDVNHAKAASDLISAGERSLERVLATVRTYHPAQPTIDVAALARSVQERRERELLAEGSADRTAPHGGDEGEEPRDDDEPADPDETALDGPASEPAPHDEPARAPHRAAPHGGQPAHRCPPHAPVPHPVQPGEWVCAHCHARITW